MSLKENITFFIELSMMELRYFDFYMAEWISFNIFQIIYKTEHKDCRRFPDPGDETLKGGVSRNFQIFDPLDFIAEITQHIPERGAHTIRYYGF